MSEFVALTDKAGKPVFVNLGLVEHIRLGRTGATLVFMRLPGLAGDNKLAVQEAPDEIIRRSNALTV
jgi:hypothetical protein